MAVIPLLKHERLVDAHTVDHAPQVHAYDLYPSHQYAFQNRLVGVTNASVIDKQMDAVERLHKILRMWVSSSYETAYSKVGAEADITLVRLILTILRFHDNGVVYASEQLTALDNFP